MIALFISFVLLLAVTYWWPSEKLERGPLPPGPKGLPVFGNLLSLMWATFKGEAPFLTLSNWGHEYGPLYYLRFANKHIVVVSDAQIAQQMCVKQAENFSDRPPELFVARVLKGTGTVKSIRNNSYIWVYSIQVFFYLIIIWLSVKSSPCLKVLHVFENTSFWLPKLNHQ